MVLCSVFILAGCGRNTYETDELDELHELRELHYETTITENTLQILAPLALRNMIEYAERRMRVMIPDFNIELTTYRGDYELMQHVQRMPTLMMAGQSYDIFFIEPQHPFLAYAQSGFLADIWQLIDDCSRFNRDDFYVQALESLTINGGLYTFPMSVGFSFVGINASLPQSIINMFTVLDTITTAQMIDIYLTLINNYPEYLNLLQISSCLFTMSPESLAMQKIMELTDFENRRTHLNDGRFAQFLEDLYIVNSSDVSDSLRYPLNLIVASNEVLEFLSFFDVFVVKSRNLSPFTAILESEGGQHFIGYIPLVDYMSRPITSMQSNMSNKRLTDALAYSYSGWRTLSIANTGNQQLAWDFVSGALLQAQLNRGTLGMHGFTGFPIFAGARSADLPILRTLAYDSISTAINLIPNPNSPIGSRLPNGQFKGFYAVIPAVNDNRSEAVNTVITHLETLVEQPLSPISLIPSDILGEHLDLMLLGVNSPIETANRLHNIISLWLIE